MTAPVTANQPAAYPPFPPHYPRQGSALSGIAITLSILGLTASGIALTASYFSNERVARLERQIDAQAGQSAQAAVAASAPVEPQPAEPATAGKPAGQAADPAGLALANLGSDDIDILPSAPDGQTYAYIRPNRMWMLFDAQGFPTEIGAAQVPAATRTLAETRAAANIPTAEVVGDASAQADAAEASLSSITDASPDLALNKLLAVPDVTAKIIAALDQLAAIEVPGPASEQRLFTFFDPRCPYCHQAFKALDGKIAMTWIPVLALGDTEDGRKIAAALMGETVPTTMVKDGETRNGVALADDTARIGRLRAVMNGQSDPAAATASLSESGAFALQENMAVMRQLYGQQADLLGVPTFIQTRPDGTAVIYRGYDEPTVKAILDTASAAAQTSPAPAEAVQGTAPPETPVASE